MAIANVFLGTAETVITTAGSMDRAVLTMTICNTDTVSHTIDLYAYPTGGSATDLYCMYKSFDIPPLETLNFTADDKIILQAGAKISGKADVASKVAVMCNYMDLG